MESIVRLGKSVEQGHARVPCVHVPVLTSTIHNRPHVYRVSAHRNLSSSRILKTAYVGTDSYKGLVECLILSTF